jgi:hypothetical protein
MSPVLTTRAKLQTPKLGHKAALDTVSVHFADSLEAKLIRTVEIEAMEELPTLDFANLPYV